MRRHAGGRNRKYPEGRSSMRLEVPKPLADAVSRQVRDDEMPLTDLGAYYMAAGWNAANPDRQIEIPTYLVEMIEAQPASPQAPLLSA